MSENEEHQDAAELTDEQLQDSAGGVASTLSYDQAAQTKGNPNLKAGIVVKLTVNTDDDDTASREG